MAIFSSENIILKIDSIFMDGDTRAISLKNPKSTITQSDIADLNNFMFEKNAIIGDKEGSSFAKITKATRITTTSQTIGHAVE